MTFRPSLEAYGNEQKESITEFMHIIKDAGVKGKKLKSIEAQVQYHSEFIAKHEDKIKQMVTK